MAETHRSRPNPEASQPPLMDVTEIWLGGYPLPLVSEFTADIDEADENTPVYGYDGTIDTKVLNAGTLTLTGINDTTMTMLFDLLAGNDPAPSAGVGLRGMYPMANFYSDVVRLWKDSTNTYYYRAEFFEKWHAALRPVGGGPKERGQITINGRCRLPLRLESNRACAILFDVAALVTGSSSVTGTLKQCVADSATHAPTVVPAVQGYVNASKYALSLEVQVRNASNVITKSSRIPVTLTNVTSAGVVTIAQSDLNGTGMTLAELVDGFAFVHYFRDEAVPTGTQKKLVASDYWTVRGRNDTVA